jgi:transcriptional regulator GlxA family with amidase domain
VSTADPRLQQALRMIHQRCTGRLPLSEVANEVRLSRWHLERLLRQTTGQTFTEHLRLARLTIGAGLLRSSFLSVKEIAAQAGYGSASSFSRDFRRMTGVSPAVWRCGAALPRPHTARATPIRIE